jgi:transposase
MSEGREEIPWSVMASILVLARFCAPSSELKIAESWYDKTALDDLLGVPGEKINDDRLYRALDALLPHKDELCRHLQARYGELFGSTFDFLFYDITSTYFEGTTHGNPQAQRGYSRDSRPDCPQVCIGQSYRCHHCAGDGPGDGGQVRPGEPGVGAGPRNGE